MASPQLRLCRDLRSTATVSPSPDVIFEILSWLPAKSLCRCRCVSKEWRALTSTPAFIATHKSRAEPLLIGMSWSVCGTMTLQLMDTDGTVVQRFLPRGDHWTLQASLGHLACLSFKYGQHCMLVVDLFTGRELLSCFTTDDGAASILMYSSCGRVPSGSLKVFRLVLPLRGEDTQLICEVLTLGDGTEAEWRQTQPPPTMISQWYTTSSNSGVTVTSALHFLSEDHHDVLSFDLDNETWKATPGPPTGFAGSKNSSISIAELNGTLCVARIVQPLVADIWLLSDPDNNVWTKAYSVRVDLLADFVIPLRRLRLGGELLFYTYDYKSKPVLQVYDPRTGKCTILKTSINLMGRIGLCSSNLDPRFRGQS